MALSLNDIAQLYLRQGLPDISSIFGYNTTKNSTTSSESPMYSSPVGLTPEQLKLLDKSVYNEEDSEDYVNPVGGIASLGVKSGFNAYQNRGLAAAEAARQEAARLEAERLAAQQAAAEQAAAQQAAAQQAAAQQAAAAQAAAYAAQQRNQGGGGEGGGQGPGPSGGAPEGSGRNQGGYADRGGGYGGYGGGADTW